MMKYLRTIVASLAVLFVLAPALPVAAQTNVFNDVCSAPGSNTSAACQTSHSDPLTGPSGIITKATQILGYITGVVSILLILVAAAMYVTSGGDSGKIQSAKSTLTYAIVGLVVVVLAQSIVVFVLRNL
ncbi:MAG TPA: hypothetical protein VIR03_04050 [Candidatus Saccharimonadales bacterium]